MQKMMLSSMPFAFPVDDKAPEWLAKAVRLARQFSQDPRALVDHVRQAADRRGIDLLHPGNPAAPVQPKAPSPQPATTSSEPLPPPPEPRESQDMKKKEKRTFISCINPDCGKRFAPTGPRSCRCPDCAEKHNLEIMRAGRLRWREKMKAAKRKFPAAEPLPTPPPTEENDTMPPPGKDKKRICIEEGCGAEFMPTGVRSLRCPECTLKHRLEMEKIRRKRSKEKLASLAVAAPERKMEAGPATPDSPQTPSCRRLVDSTWLVRDDRDSGIVALSIQRIYKPDEGKTLRVVLTVDEM